MLAIRLKRTGRRGHAQYRVVVQDAQLSPSSGRVVAYLGSYNPHTKTTSLDKEKIAGYLGNGAQPSDRVAKLLQAQGVDLPKWVKVGSPKQKAIRNPEKLRRNRPEGEAEAPAPEAAEETPEPKTEEAAPETADSVDAEAPAAEEAVETEAPAEVAENSEPATEEEPTKDES